MAMNFHLIPVIKSGAFDGFIINAEAEFAYQMQGRKGRRAESSDIAGIRRYLRLNKGYMKLRFLVFHRQRSRGDSLERRRNNLLVIEGEFRQAFDFVPADIFGIIGGSGIAL